MKINVSEIRVHFGSGHVAASGWLNYDASPVLWLERLPIFGKLVKLNKQRFPDEVLFGNIVTGLPVGRGTVVAVYASHVLEHLSYDDFWRALHNTFDLLSPGGVFRLVVPDLRARASRYLAKTERNDPDASINFMRETFLGKETTPRTLSEHIRGILGNSSHLWMWDETSISDALMKIGFTEIRRCRLGDASDPAFSSVEHADRFVDGATGDLEVAMEARKPEN